MNLPSQEDHDPMRAWVESPVRPSCSLLGRYPKVVANTIFHEYQPAALDELIIKISKGKIKIIPKDLEGHGYLLRFWDGEHEILYDKKDTQKEQNMTKAHELGHWLLGRKFNMHNTDQSIEDWCEDFAEALVECFEE